MEQERHLAISYLMGQILAPFGVLVKQVARAGLHAKDHYGLVAKIAMSHIQLKRGEKIEETEAFADGLYGLARAMEVFDPARGFQFSTLAFYCIRNEIQKNLKKRRINPRIRIDWEDSEIDLQAPEDLTEKRAKDAKEQVDLILGRMPNNLNKKVLIEWFLKERTLQDIGAELGVSKERVRQRKEEALKQIREMVLA